MRFPGQPVTLVTDCKAALDCAESLASSGQLIVQGVMRSRTFCGLVLPVVLCKGSIVLAPVDGRDPGHDRSLHGLTAEEVLGPFMPTSLCPTQQTTSAGTLAVRIASFNVSYLSGSAPKEDCTVREVGLALQVAKPFLLAESLRAVNVAAAALQETRCEQGVISCGDYLRFVLALRVASSEMNFGSSLDMCWFSLMVADLVSRGTTSAPDMLIPGVCLFCMPPRCNAEPQDPAGSMWHDILEDFSLWLPATFEECHEGQAWTYAQKRGGHLTHFDYIDYVALPKAWRDGQVSSWIDPTVHAGQPVLDHMAALCDVTATVGKFGTRKHSRRRRLDEAAVLHPDNREAVEQIIHDAPDVPWEVSSHVHAAALVSHLQQKLGQQFLLQKRRGARHFCQLKPWMFVLHLLKQGGNAAASDCMFAIKCFESVLNVAQS